MDFLSNIGDSVSQLRLYKLIRTVFFITYSTVCYQPEMVTQEITGWSYVMETSGREMIKLC